MTEKRTVVEQFGPAAADYATFSYHAAGPDLAPMLAAAELRGGERVLDLGCGPGHVALLFAPHVSEVVALDPTEAMLVEARRLAGERRIDNVRFELGRAEAVPGPEAAFDRVVSRQSAHHWGDIRRAVGEIGRVLAPGGRFVLIDTFAPEEPSLDGFLNRVELLRDSSHVRDYTVSEWRSMLADVGLEMEEAGTWNIPIEFDSWLRRSRTPETEIAELRRCFGDASPAQRETFEITADRGFRIPVGLIVARGSALRRWSRARRTQARLGTALESHTVTDRSTRATTATNTSI